MNTRDLPRLSLVEKIAATAFCLSIAVFCFTKIQNGWEVTLLASIGTFFLASAVIWSFVALFAFMDG